MPLAHTHLPDTCMETPSDKAPFAADLRRTHQMLHLTHGSDAYSAVVPLRLPNALSNCTVFTTPAIHCIVFLLFQNQNLRTFLALGRRCKPRRNIKISRPRADDWQGNSSDASQAGVVGLATDARDSPHCSLLTLLHQVC